MFGSGYTMMINGRQMTVDEALMEANGDMSEWMFSLDYYACNI